ncbi:MAG: hypothetical protein G01um101456_190 [Parcubacteria group bacterium Gr01-1014_56]|nr:MAG: hypothetical protein G01um101456_190 [Parcubacteria group bacterium Gr01-1014_56]
MKKKFFALAIVACLGIFFLIDFAQAVIGTPVLRGTGGSLAVATTATTTFTPSANDLLLAMVYARTGAATAPTISDDLGGIWAEISNSSVDAGNVVGRIFYQVIGASPAAMLVTGVSTGALQTAIAVVSVSGAGIDFSNFNRSTGTTGDATTTMAAYQATSIAIEFYASNAGGASSPPSGFTELYDSALASNLRGSISYDMVAPTTTLIRANTGTDVILYGLEVKEPPTPNPRIIRLRGGIRLLGGMRLQ